MPADPSAAPLEEVVAVALSTDDLPRRLSAAVTVRAVPALRRPYDWQRDE
jgi:hypothetical protein